MANRRKLLRSVPEVVKAFGGTTAMAKWCNVKSSAVSNWIDRNYIPPGWHYRMAAKLDRDGLDVDPRVFGVSGSAVENHPFSRRVA